MAKTINHLFKQGANVIYDAITGVHVSGHARQEELKLMLSLVRPRFFVPVHGEYRHLVQHARLAQELGYPAGMCLLPKSVMCWNLRKQEGLQVEFTPPVFVDGLGVGDVGNIVLRDQSNFPRWNLNCGGHDRQNQRTGFIRTGHCFPWFCYVREAKPLLDVARQRVKETLEKCLQEKSSTGGLSKDNCGRCLVSTFTSGPNGGL